MASPTMARPTPREPVSRNASSSGDATLGGRCLGPHGAEVSLRVYGLHGPVHLGDSNHIRAA